MTGLAYRYGYQDALDDLVREIQELVRQGDTQEQILGYVRSRSEIYRKTPSDKDND